MADRPTAGILVVDPHELPAFADALDRKAVAAAAAAGPGGDPWLLALAALLEVTEVAAVEAAPFCASRQAMDLPPRAGRSAPARRRQPVGRPRHDGGPAAGIPPADTLGRADLPSPELLTAGGLAFGLVAAVLVGATGRLGLLLGALLFVAADVLLLADAELARYWRRPSARGARGNRLAARIVEAAMLFGLGCSAGLAGSAWLAIAALGASAAVMSMVAARGACDAAAHGHRPVRWLLIAAAMIAAAVSSHSGSWGLWAALVGSIAACAAILVTAARKPRSPEFQATPASRFLVPPGSLVDVGGQSDWARPRSPSLGGARWSRHGCGPVRFRGADRARLGPGQPVPVGGGCRAGVGLCGCFRAPARR